MLSKVELIDREKTSLEFFIEQVEFNFECFDDNTSLVIQLIDLLKQKYCLLF